MLVRQTHGFLAARGQRNTPIWSRQVVFRRFGLESRLPVVWPSPLTHCLRGWSRAVEGSPIGLAGSPAAGGDRRREWIPFWSPDSRFIAFRSGSKLKKVEASGGPPQTLCSFPDRGGGSGAWNRDGVVIFDAPDGHGFRRVSAEGGDVSALMIPGGEHFGPVFLPDGRHFFYGQARILNIGQPTTLMRRERCLPLWKETAADLRAWMAVRGAQE